MNNIHEELGWFTCANARCRAELDRDHVTLITTTRVRRFCSVECITDGQAAWRERLNDPASPECQRLERAFQANPQEDV